MRCYENLVKGDIVGQNSAKIYSLKVETWSPGHDNLMPVINQTIYNNKIVIMIIRC